MRRVAVIIGVVLGLAALAGSPVRAHPGELDARGGHICRPEGGGAADCAAFGLDVGEYHCEQDPCAQEIERTARAWCRYGIPVPMKSSLVGAYPTGDFTPAIRVVRLLGPGHVLEVERDIEPQMQGPEDCLNSDRALELELESDELSEHLAARGPELYGAAEPVRPAAVELVPLRDGDARGSAPLAALALTALALTAMALTAMALGGRRRPAGYWEPHGA